MNPRKGSWYMVVWVLGTGWEPVSVKLLGSAGKRAELAPHLLSPPVLRHAISEAVMQSFTAPDGELALST